MPILSVSRQAVEGTYSYADHRSRQSCERRQEQRPDHRLYRYRDHWTDKQETEAAVDNLISDTLWAELPECYDEISISEYRQWIYEYVFTRYRVAA